MSTAPRILLVVGGGIAAYKSCELVRLIRKAGGSVTCVLTEGGAQFVTAMTLAALSENKVYTSLWNLKDEAEMGHIQLSREADLVVVCPATADLMAKMAAGIADDLATTLILATDKPVLTVPAMNVRMWLHDATQRNVERLRQAGVRVMNPDNGEMACGEYGPGRLPEPEAIWREIADSLGIATDASASGSEIEALEPEDDGESDEKMADMLSSIITRSKAAAAEGEGVPFEDLPYPEAEEATDGDVQGEPTPTPDLSGPLLARKGKASAAPPTDPEAINHTVRTGSGKAKPEPIPGDAGNPSVEGDTVTGIAPIEDETLPAQPKFAVAPGHRPLKGKHVLVTAGPTHEPIDPVRYIANRSSGRQGYAIAAAAAALGAKVTLVSGPVTLKTPAGVNRIDVESAREMADAVKKALPADAAVMVAAVADWRSKEFAAEKIKKRGNAPPAVLLTENPDILATVASGTKRPKLLVGFAAETENLIENAKKKRKAKGADWIVANDVTGTAMGGPENTVHIVTAKAVDSWEAMSKEDVALKLMERIADALK